MKKTIFTFGSNHLQDINIDPMHIMLVIDKPEKEARDFIFNDSFIGEKFAFSYPYSEAKIFKEDFGMIEITYDELLNLKRDKNGI